MSFDEGIAVLITCHNRREKTLVCLRALFAQSIPKGLVLEVFLVDDGSTDGTGDAVRMQFPRVNVLRGNGHLYWCGGMRFAWAEAMKDDFDAYLWLNDDAILLPNAIETILATARKGYAREGCKGIVVGSCRDPESGKHTYGGRVKRNRRTHLPDQLLPPEDKILPCDTMNGNLVFVPREVVNRLGNLSPEFTHAFGDVDYGLRARRQSIPLSIAPGYLAECAANNRVPSWINSRVSIIDRWRDMCSPRGLPPKQWYLYVRRHTGWKWPVYLLKPFVRILFPWLWVDTNSSQ